MRSARTRSRRTLPISSCTPRERTRSKRVRSLRHAARPRRGRGPNGSARPRPGSIISPDGRKGAMRRRHGGCSSLSFRRRRLRPRLLPCSSRCRGMAWRRVPSRSSSAPGPMRHSPAPDSTGSSAPTPPCSPARGCGSTGQARPAMRSGDCAQGRSTRPRRAPIARASSPPAYPASRLPPAIRRPSSNEPSRGRRKTPTT